MIRLMREGLCHNYPGFPADDFFTAIDATGGWPLGYAYVGFEHTDAREAGFCNSLRNTGWWTVIASADDYYLWKLSPEALKRITDTAVDHFIKRLRPNTDPSKMWFKSCRGGRSAIAKAAPKFGEEE